MPIPSKLSTESRAVLDAARVLYRDFYANVTHTPWMDSKIETWDVGYYQICRAMKSLNSARSVAEIQTLRSVHDALRAKLLPQIYLFGFLNPDVKEFT